MDIRIFQIFYDAAQRSRLDPGFIPYDNTANPRPAWREYHVFRTAYLQGDCPPDALTGFVSWKFRTKTRTSAAAFHRFIRRHPGRDVYFVNPARLESGSFANIWQQGEFHHPGLIDLAETAFRAAGRPLALATLEHPPAATLFCNFWVGTRRFWDRYMAFCEPIFAAIEAGLPSAAATRLDARADRTIDACYRPFLVERLFTTLLALDPTIRWAGCQQRTWRRLLPLQAA
jgi:hypothetical protein